ncbi:MAG: Rrf2 family transcriptional regulator [Planctomycetes bacterium]|nr:Rrf2 family transcriptional regulator [Planctomycetota bacterium]
MQISQKCQYALYALVELALRDEAGSVTIDQIAAAQDIPRQFLQAILRELRQGGFVESRRGKEGGYLLARPARNIKASEVIVFFEGNLSLVEGVDGKGLPLDDKSARSPLLSMWAEAACAVTEVLGRYSIADFADASRRGGPRHGLGDFVI